jgi:hypothetical protein
MAAVWNHENAADDLKIYQQLQRDLASRPLQRLYDASVRGWRHLTFSLPLCLSLCARLFLNRPPAFFNLPLSLSPPPFVSYLRHGPLTSQISLRPSSVEQQRNRPVIPPRRSTSR